MILPSDIKKVILYPAPKSTTENPPYPDGTKIFFHYKAFVEEDGEVMLDDTRMMSKPMELIIGKQFKLQAWELLLQTMRPGEVAQVNLPIHYVVCYPMVSKAVRDANKGSPPTHQAHCCGMMQQGIGYTDLDQLMEHPKPINFVFEMLKADRPGEYETESWQLSHEEKLKSVPLLQTQGNELFADGDVQGARAKYFEAIARLEQLSLREQPGSTEAKDLEESKVPLLLNYSLCLMKQDEFYEALQHLSTAVNTSPSNVKGLFRRGKCHRAVGNFEEAKNDLKRALDMDPSLRAAVLKELDEILQDEKNIEEKDKARFKNLFKS